MELKNEFIKEYIPYFTPVYENEEKKNPIPDDRKVTVYCKGDGESGFCHNTRRSEMGLERKKAHSWIEQEKLEYLYRTYPPNGSEEAEKAFEKDKENYFKEIICDGFEIKTNTEKSNDVIFEREGETYFEIKGSTVLVHKDKIWWYYKSVFGMDYMEIQRFLAKMIKKHLHIKEPLPNPND